MTGFTVLSGIARSCASSVSSSTARNCLYRYMGTPCRFVLSEAARVAKAHTLLGEDT